ncbi:hypothetical protein KIMH_00960 [Bombiscardovia apis]|uniref:Uncharacterized protein n=1 Tax=Bombiscardovia apis TaxID=2932182 RepID=A0ABM8BBL3_9BIFI|nr:hypothetical protein [Bombiscardovia apis]BDR53985.1 hypothetical protein KIMH_00960 [Bombiscardovia apis]
MHYFEPKRCASTSKIMYHDKLAAQRAADLSLIERGAQLWVYRCQYCGSWHLTSHDPEGYLPTVSRGPAKPRSRKRGFKPRRK